MLLLEALGSEIMVHFSIDAPVVDTGDPDEPEEIAHDGVNAVGRFSPRSHVSVGDPVEVAVTTENLHFFDAQSRKAIYD